MMKMGTDMTCERCKLVFPRKAGNQRYCRDCNILKDREWQAERLTKKKIEAMRELARDKNG